MDIIVESVKLASTFHSRERKKKSIPGIPKMGHLMEVAGIVQSNGGDEITVAVILHRRTGPEPGAATGFWRLLSDNLEEPVSQR